VSYNERTQGINPVGQVLRYLTTGGGFYQSAVGPAFGVSQDPDIEKSIRENSETAYHPIGTCRMGPISKAANAVVDENLKVHGLDGLRIADASIFPTMPSGNTNATSIMVGKNAPI